MPGLLHCPVTIHIGVERRCRDPQPPREIRGPHLLVRHRRHRQAQRLPVHFSRTSSLAAPGPGGRQASPCPLGDQFALDFRQGCEDPEHQPSVRRRRVDLRTGACQHLQPHFAAAQIIHHRYQVPEIPPESVQLPDGQGVAGLQRLQAGLEAWPVVLSAGHPRSS